MSTPITIFVPFFEGSYSDDHDAQAFPGHLGDAQVEELLRTGKLWKPSDDPETFDLSVNVHEDEDEDGEGEWEGSENAEFQVGDGVVIYRCTHFSYTILHTYLSA